MSFDYHVIHLENGCLAADTPPGHVVDIVGRALDNPGSGGIVLHFHGGLVRYGLGMGIAQRLAPVYSNAGSYPVFFVWESGLIETLQNNFTEIARETFFRLVLKRVAAMVARKFQQGRGDRAAGMLPAIDAQPLETALDIALDSGNTAALDVAQPTIPAAPVDLSNSERMQLENELMADPQLVTAIQRISQGLLTPAQVQAATTSRAPRVQGSTQTLMDPAALDRFVERPDPNARGAIATAKLLKAVVSIAFKVVSRFVRGRDHGFHATVVEEILRELYLANVGELIWGAMKQDTEDAFGSDPKVYGGKAVLQALADRIDPANPPRITLVGHSTGAIYISEFLDHAIAMLPSSVNFGVVFLAPAARFEVTAKTLDQHKSRIHGFRMFTMCDERERQDKLVPVLYPHSLLYFISGVLEGGDDVPIVGMERYYDASDFPDASFPQVKMVRDYVLAAADRVAWSVTKPGAPDGQRTESIKHGDFDNEDKTVNSVAHILNQGF